MTENPFPFFNTFDSWHTELETGLQAKYKDIDIFRYEDTMQNIVKETPYYKDAFFHINFATTIDTELNIDDKTYDCRNGGVFFFMAPEQLIHWKRGGTPWKGYVILMKPEFLAYFIQGSHLLKELNLFRREGIHVIQTDSATEPTFVQIFETILQEYNGDKSMRFEMIAAYLKVLLIHAQRVSNMKADPQPANRKDDLTYNFQKLVDKYFSTKKSIYDYARELNVSEKYLNQVIKSKTGKPAGSFIKEKIIIEAKCLLQYTSLDVKEIAYELNYDESSNFIRFFKTNTQLTPVQYRKSTVAEL